jgi:hypothetical protein
MRYLFYLVLLGNVFFYVWQLRTAALKPLTEPVKESNSFEHQILLLSETQSLQEDGLKSQLPEQSEEPQKKTSDDSLAILDPENELICFETGPFDDKELVLVWDAQNPIRAENLSFNIKDIEIVSGYVVYYPAAKTILQAEENIANLGAKGLGNLWLFKFGDMKGAISIGFYDDEAEAKQILKNLEKLGVDAKIKAHSKVKNHTFAQITWNIDKREVSALIADYKENFPDHKVERLKECSISDRTN